MMFFSKVNWAAQKQLLLSNIKLYSPTKRKSKKLLAKTLINSQYIKNYK